MNLLRFPFLVVMLAAGGIGISSAQQADLGISDSSGGGLYLSAGGTCLDDCWVQSTPIGEGSSLAIMKGTKVVDQGYVDAPLNVTSDDPGPPPSGTGSKSVSFEAHGVNDKAESGAWVTTITYVYSDFMLRDVQAKVDWVPDLPEGEDGG